MERSNDELIDLLKEDIKHIELIMDKILCYSSGKDIHCDSIYYKAAIFDCLSLLRSEIVRINNEIFCLKDDLPFY